MKKLIIVALSLFSLSAFAASPLQGEKHHGKKLTPQQRMELHLDRMQKSLDLSAKQRNQVKTILEDAHSQRRALHQQTKEQLNEVLNTEQQNRMQQQRDAHRNRMMKHYKAKHKQWKQGGRAHHAHGHKN